MRNTQDAPKPLGACVNSDAPLTHGGLFFGIGTFSMGFQEAGIRMVWAVENDPKCQSVTRRHWPGIPIHDDVKTVGAHNLQPVDIISFGSPCQDLSIAGKRKGLAGERSGLFHEAIRIVDELKPTVAMWENVCGALSSHAGRDFAAVLAAFRELGARDIAWRVLDSQYRRVAQRRRRIILVADFGGERAGEILFEPDRVSWHPPTRRQARQRVTGTLADSSGSRGWSSSVDCQMWTEEAPASPEAFSDAESLGGHHARYDLDSQGAYIPERGLSVFKRRGGFGWSENHDVTPTLESQGGSHQGSPDNLPMVLGALAIAGVDNARYGKGANTTIDDGAIIAIQDASIPRDKSQNGVGIVEGGPMFTLDTLGGHGIALPTTALAFNWQSGGDVRHDVTEERTGTLHAGQVPAVLPAPGPRAALAFDLAQITSAVNRTRVGDNLPASTMAANPQMMVAHTLTGEGFDASEDGTGRGTPLISEASLAPCHPEGVNLRGRQGGATAELSGNVSMSLRASQGGGDKAHVLSAWRVRRLTPRETERLQALPDDFTRWGDDGKEISDSARYKMVGNAGTVTVFSWVGKRMVIVLGAAR